MTASYWPATLPYKVVAPNSTNDDADSLVVQVMVAVLTPGVPDEISDMVGAVVSEEAAVVTKLLCEERLVFPAASVERTR